METDNLPYLHAYRLTWVDILTCTPQGSYG